MNREESFERFILSRHRLQTSATIALILSVFTTVALFLPTVNRFFYGFPEPDVDTTGVFPFSAFTAVSAAAAIVLNCFLFQYVRRNDVRRFGCLLAGASGEALKCLLYLGVLAGVLSGKYDVEPPQLTLFGWVVLISGVVNLILLIRMLLATRGILQQLRESRWVKSGQ